MNTINLLEKIKNFYLLFEDDGEKDGELIPTEQSKSSEPEPSEPSKPLEPEPPEQEHQKPSEQLVESIKNFFKGLLNDFASWKKENGNEKSFKEFTNYLKKLDGVDISKIDKIIN